MIDKMNRYNIGDIFLNKFAGFVDCRYFIYLGVSGNFVNGLEFINGKPNKTKYYKKDILKGKNYHDGTNAFIKVGHTNFLDIAKQDLLKEKIKDDKFDKENI